MKSPQRRKIIFSDLAEDCKAANFMKLALWGSKLGSLTARFVKDIFPTSTASRPLPGTLEENRLVQSRNKASPFASELPCQKELPWRSQVIVLLSFNQFQFSEHRWEPAFGSPRSLDLLRASSAICKGVARLGAGMRAVQPSRNLELPAMSDDEEPRKIPIRPRVQQFCPANSCRPH